MLLQSIKCENDKNVHTALATNFAFSIAFPWNFLFFIFCFLPQRALCQCCEHVTPAPTFSLFQCFINYILLLNKLIFFVFMSMLKR